MKARSGLRQQWCSGTSGNSSGRVFSGGTNVNKESGTVSTQPSLALLPLDPLVLDVVAGYFPWPYLPTSISGVVACQAR